MAAYELSKEADKDFAEIFNYGIEQFGLAQALTYQNGMAERLNELAKQPKLYPTIDHIREGYRRSTYGSHSIYYRIEPNRIIIVRILSKQDCTKAF